MQYRVYIVLDLKIATIKRSEAIGMCNVACVGVEALLTAIYIKCHVYAITFEIDLLHVG